MSSSNESIAGILIRPGEEAHPVPIERTPPPTGGWWHVLAVISLIVIPGTVYLATLQRGVSRGDSAEIQYLCPLLGICHSPGYAIEVTCGYLFSLLPLSPDVAWRINLMMAVSGIAGCLAMYGTVRRITGRIPPGLIAAGLLAFSSIYWSYSTVAEEYVFHGAVLLFGAYAAVRFVHSDRATWLCWTALAAGIATAGRPSELFVLPAFVGLWLGCRQRVRLTARRLGVALILYLLPFVYSVGFIMLRDDPRYLHARDGILAEEILGQPSNSSLSGWPRVKNAVYYSLGLTWANHRESWKDRLDVGTSRYARLLSGVEAVTPTKLPIDPMQLERGLGAAIGIPGLLLAAAGIVFYRRQYGWVLLGLGFFLGNLAFYFWHQAWDALTFTVPGLAGLALLGGLGAAGPPPRDPVQDGSRRTEKGRWWRGLAYAVGGLTVLVLAIGNYHIVDHSHLTDAAEVTRTVAAVRTLPPDSIILTTYWPATKNRYLAYVLAGRSDVRILAIDQKQWKQAVAYAGRHGRVLFVFDNTRINADERKMAQLRTPPAAAEAGLLQLVPQSRLTP